MSKIAKKSPVVFLKSSRVYLRPFELDDLPTLLIWINDPELRPFLSRTFPINESKEREYIEKLSCGPDQFAFLICDAKSNRRLGCCGLHGIQWPCRSAELGIFLGEEKSRGAGMGSEVFELLLEYAFQRLNLHRCWLQVYANNLRAIRCYERLGFVAEGADREAHFADGVYHDILRYSILDREWRAKGPASLNPETLKPTRLPR
jgi:RimJ/RimL family protein N-acetyltransferase